MPPLRLVPSKNKEPSAFDAGGPRVGCISYTKLVGFVPLILALNNRFVTPNISLQLPSSGRNCRWLGSLVYAATAAVPAGTELLVHVVATDRPGGTVVSDKVKSL